MTLKPQEKIKIIEKRNENIDIFRVKAENHQEIGFSIQNSEKKIVQELSTSIADADALQGRLSPFPVANKDLANRLTSAGIRTADDDTFVIDEPKLKRALEVNAEETLRIFTDEEAGLFPLLSDKLENLLRENLGDLDQKRDQVLVKARNPNLLAEKFRQFTEASRLSNVVQNLITVA